MVKELDPSTAPHYRDFCHDNGIDLTHFRQVSFRKNGTKYDDFRLNQALSQIATEPSVDSRTLLVRNVKNASGELLDVLLIPSDAPYYNFPEDNHFLPPIREGDMFVVNVSRRDRSRPGFEYLAVVQDKEAPQAKLERAASIALREVSVIWGCNHRELLADTNAVTRAEFVDKIRNLKRRGVNVRHSITERLPELETRSSRPVAA